LPSVNQRERAKLAANARFEPDKIGMAKEEKAKKEAMETPDGAPAPKKKMAGKQLILFVALPAVILLLGGGAAAMLLGGKPKDEAHAADGETAETAAEAGNGEEKEGKEGKDPKAGGKDAKGKGSKGKDAKGKDAKGKGGKGDAEEGGAYSAEIVEGADGAYFYTLPDILVNIDAGDKPVYLKMKLTIESGDYETAEKVQPVLPRVLDQYQAFLRELRVDDLSGSAGAYRVRAELLRRLNLAIAPAEARAVLIEEMLVQ